MTCNSSKTYIVATKTYSLSFLAPKTCYMGKKNIYNFTLKNSVYLIKTCGYLLFDYLIAKVGL